MSDFEIEGINLLKQALTQMSRQPKARLGRDNSFNRLLMDEIYVEIRSARIAGYSYKDLSTVIQDRCKIKIHPNTVSSLFRELDLKYEKETGIKALPVAKGNVAPKKTKPPEVSNGIKDVDGLPVCTYTGKRRGRPRQLRTEEE